jgi:hypothetical protein
VEVTADVRQLPEADPLTLSVEKHRRTLDTIRFSRKFAAVLGKME